MVTGQTMGRSQTRLNYQIKLVCFNSGEMRRGAVALRQNVAKTDASPADKPLKKLTWKRYQFIKDETQTVPLG